MRANRLATLIAAAVLAWAAVSALPKGSASASIAMTAPHPAMMTAVPSTALSTQASEADRRELELTPQEMEANGWTALEVLLIAAALLIVIAIAAFVFRHHRTGRAG